jgi:hypothetical protein
MTITPDTKDWTWVLERVCPECGFDSRSFAKEQIPALLLANAKPWPQVLAGPGDPRPRDDVWSPLEYACHVRDVCRLFAQRLELMLTRDDPIFPNWDQDATAVEDRYGEQDPDLVSGELTEAAHRLAEAFAAVADEQWQRRGARSDGARFTVESFGRYLLHDLVHHLHDVTAPR